MWRNGLSTQIEKPSDSRKMHRSTRKTGAISQGCKSKMNWSSISRKLSFVSGGVSPRTRAFFKQQELPWYILAPDSYVRRTVDFAVIAAVWVTIFLVPIQVVYPAGTGLQVFYLLVDLIFLANVVANMVTTFPRSPGDNAQGTELDAQGRKQRRVSTLGQEERAALRHMYSRGHSMRQYTLEDRVGLVWGEYAIGYLWVDLVPVLIGVYLDLLPLCMGYSGLSLEAGSLEARLWGWRGQLLAFGKLLAILQHTRSFCRLKKFNSRVKRLWRLVLDKDLALRIRILQMFGIFLIFNHYMGLMFLFIANRENSDGWIDSQEFSPSESYLESMYWALATSLTIGYGDISPVTVSEKSYTLVMFIAAYLIHTCITGAVTVLFEHMDKTNTEFIRQLTSLSSFFKVYRREISTEMRHRVIRYVDLTTQSKHSQTDFLSKHLPYHVMRDLKMAMVKDLVQKCTLFQDCSPDFIHQVVMAMEPVSCLEGDYLFQMGDFAREMYFVHHGEMEVIVQDVAVATLSTGKFFGEVALLQHVSQRTATIRAKVNSQLFMLSREKLKEILHYQPGLISKLEKAANQKLTKDAIRNMQSIRWASSKSWLKVDSRKPVKSPTQKSKAKGPQRFLSKSNSLFFIGRMQNDRSQKVSDDNSCITPEEIHQTLRRAGSKKEIESFLDDSIHSKLSQCSEVLNPVTSIDEEVKFEAKQILNESERRLPSPLITGTGGVTRSTRGSIHPFSPQFKDSPVSETGDQDQNTGDTNMVSNVSDRPANSQASQQNHRFFAPHPPPHPPPSHRRAEIQGLAMRMMSSINLQDYRHHMRTHKGCFLGSDAVTWMVNGKVAKDRNEAMDKGMDMMQLGLIKPLTDSDRTLKDEQIFYKFNLDDSLSSTAADKNNRRHGRNSSKECSEPNVYDPYALGALDDLPTPQLYDLLGNISQLLKQRVIQ